NRVVEASIRFPARPATIPPQLPEWDPAWSRIGEAQSTDGTHALRVLDTLPTLRAAGHEPADTIVALHGKPTWAYRCRRRGRDAADAARSGGRVWRHIAPDPLEMGFSERLAHEAMPTPKSAEVRRIRDRIADFDAVVRTLFAEAAGSADAAVTS